MLTKAQVKDIRSLAQHKYREEKNAFVVEGIKMAGEWLHAGTGIEMILGPEPWLERNEALIQQHPGARVIAISEDELSGISSLQTPNQVLLVVTKPKPAETFPQQEWSLALESIRDPGNMGTIIRIADWFGIAHVIASPDSADFYNPKVVQAAMGGHLRVQLHSTELGAYLESVEVPVIAAILEGGSVYNAPQHEAAILLIGNESKGLSDELVSLATERVAIPKRGGAESLNAAVSAGILCALLMPH